MAIDEAKQAFIFLKAFSEVGGSYPSECAEDVQARMRDISLREFGEEKYAFAPLDLTTISREEFGAGNIIRNKDRSISITEYGKFIERVLETRFIQPKRQLG